MYCGASVYAELQEVTKEIDSLTFFEVVALKNL